MSKTAWGSESRFKHHRDSTVPSAYALQHELMSMEDDNENDDDGNGEEKFGFSEDDGGENDDENDGENGFALLDNDIDEGNNGLSEDNGEPPQGFIQEGLEKEGTRNSDGKAPTRKFSIQIAVFLCLLFLLHIQSQPRLTTTVTNSFITGRELFCSRN